MSHVLSSMQMSFSIRSKKKMVLTVTRDAGRYDNMGHFRTHSKPKQRCKMCQSYVRMKCIKCNCHLCITKDKTPNVVILKI